MNKIVSSALGALERAGRASLAWLSLPLHALFAAIGLALSISLLSLAFADPSSEAVFFFPSSRGSALKGELRDLPRRRGAEARAELLASELLLGPSASGLSPAFLPGSRLESVLYRKGRLYVDISAEAALAAPADLKMGLAALRRTLRMGFPWLKELKLTIGGREAYSEGIESGIEAKKEKDN